MFFANKEIMDLYDKSMKDMEDDPAFASTHHHYEMTREETQRMHLQPHQQPKRRGILTLDHQKPKHQTNLSPHWEQLLRLLP